LGRTREFRLIWPFRVRFGRESDDLKLTSKILFRLLVGILLSIQSAAALTVQINGDLPEDILDRLSGASLLVEQANNTDAASQDPYASAKADYARLLSVLYEAGYFGAEISIKLDGREAANVAAINAPKSANSAVIAIQPGPVFRYGTAQVQPIAPGTELPKGFATGETAGLSSLRGASEKAISGWRDRGYAKAKIVDQKVTADHRNAILNAALQVNAGQQLKFGNLTVKGNKRVRTERILDIAGYPQGEVFSPEALDKSAKRLRRTGAFGSVAFSEAENVGLNQTLDITLDISEQRRRRVGFGGDVSTSDGLSLSAFWMHRNLLGGAERLRIEGEISGIGGDTGGDDYRLSARFERPATFGPDRDLYALAEIEELNEVNYFTRQATIGAGVNWIASERREYEYGIGLMAAETRDAFGEDEYLLFIIPAETRRDYRDNKLDATKGYYLRANATPFAAIRGADDGVRAFADYRIYRSFGVERPVTLAFRAQLGSVIGPSLADAPSDFVFYSGGGGTVRGQPYESLGVDVGGLIAGGRSFLGLSAEARFKVTETIGIVGFYDYGFIGSDAFPSEGSGDSQSGAGIGVRYQTPIGPIRFDVAVPVNGPNDSNNFEIYIGIGQAF
jgi:translocation and assembly module TamA